MSDVTANRIVTNFNGWEEDDFVQGGLLLVDKPIEWTSFDVVNKLRWAMKNRAGRKLKVGHAGTLDPLATGLLIIGFGRGTKLMEALQGQDKNYVGTIQLGAETATYDAEGAIEARYATEHIDTDLIAQAARHFTGVQEQVPPIFSAIKVGGKKAYDMARKGQQIELKARQITIHHLMLHFDQKEKDVLTFDVQCSKGTYIRSLAFDIGKYVKSGAYLSGLRRTQIGELKIEDAKTIEDWIVLLESND